MPFCKYRRIGYMDDGVTRYACMDCKNEFCIRDDPRYYNFCPKCGTSWFGQYECREHYVPRWYYDRHGNHGPHGLDMYPEPFQHTRAWLVQVRTRFIYKNPVSDEWGPWETKHHLRPFLGSWRDALRYLNMMKRDYEDEEGWCEHQCRVIFGEWPRR